MPDILFEPTAWADYLWWQRQDRQTLRRVNALLAECLRTPYEGSGRPEPLRGDLAGYWSCRIDHANRLVYAVRDGGEVVVIACRDHYTAL
jgi:toxin YoeB